MTESDLVIKALSGIRVSVVSREFDIHDKIADALTACGVGFTREARLAPRCRIDFLTKGGLGIEVKKGRPDKSRLLEQVTRYCEADAVKSMLVVVEKNTTLPVMVAGKPCRILRLNALWGVALP